MADQWTRRFQNDWRPPFEMDQWLPWYIPLEGRLPSPDAQSKEKFNAAEAYNALLPYMHPRDISKWARQANQYTMGVGGRGGPFEPYGYFGQSEPANYPGSWGSGPSRLSLSEEYGYTDSGRIQEIARILLGTVYPVEGQTGVPPFTHDEDTGVIDVIDPLRSYISNILGAAHKGAPGAAGVGARRTMSQEAEYQRGLEEAFEQLGKAIPEGSPDYWSDFLREIVQPSYYSDPTANAQAPSPRRYRYLMDVFKPYSSGYWGY